LERILIVGHVTFDVILAPSFIVKGALGGSPTYAGTALSLLGFKVVALSKVGPDFKDPYVLRLAKSMDLSGLKRSLKPTTSFELSYLSGTRSLRLLSLCEPLTLSDLESGLSYDCLYIGPVANELTPALLNILTEDSAFKSLGVQGLLRSFKPNGEVALKPNPSLFDLLPRLDLVCGSADEILVALSSSDLKSSILKLSRLGPSFVAVTLGEEGSLITNGHGLIRVPAYRTKAIDPTGAGDVYAGVLTAFLCRGEDLKWSACLATAAASFIVEGVGPSRFGFKHEVEERARKLLDRVEED